MAPPAHRPASCRTSPAASPCCEYSAACAFRATAMNMQRVVVVVLHPELSTEALEQRTTTALASVALDWIAES
ncbi:hypothetical protein OsI_29958 [Oryza sativa Indica Group]|uniref:Uncharacterized protein n=7 Tax=Oryza TaxID=4527 RepID=Q84QW2_ORYSJ|nr:hypothetical protein OsI_29958 [Oryza sativa Indica Group]EAZ43394.1 hypothetical protein OsJ_28000 [Oryza sativa Japonica Group]BAC75415.1 hypothetical protein [Oryza sativa Japonica Group]